MLSTGSDLYVAICCAVRLVRESLLRGRICTRVFTTGSNWYVYIFCAGSLVFGWLIAKLSDICKRKGWVEYYETKSSEAKGPSYEYDLAPLGSPSGESNGESESNGRDTPTMDIRCDTPTHSEPDSENSDWDYRNEEQIKIVEENRIT